MKELPMIFPTPSVQAILEGRKTMDRRIIKADLDSRGVRFTNRWEDWHGNIVKCPFGKSGDILWVRETFRKYCHVDEYGYTHFDKEILEFAADNPPMLNEVDGDGCQIFNKDGTERFIRWRPSTQLPKAAARIWLQVEDIKVERLQDISEEDAKAEGVEPRTHRCGGFGYYEAGGDTYECTCQSWEGDEYYMGFKDMWTEKNSPESWEANPWVWAVSFKVLSTTGKPETLTQTATNEQ